jgi:GH15 family glucan-1,4-alpha-glucosidase
MPRSLTLGNGRLLVNFDSHYQLRDFYFPCVGKENHSLGHPFRFGVWCEGAFSWTSGDDWERELRYAEETMVTEVVLTNGAMELRLRCADAVDFHEDVYLRRVAVENLADRQREVRLFLCQDFHIAESASGDTAYCRPWERVLVHYKGPQYFLINACTDRHKYNADGSLGSSWHPWIHPEDGNLPVQEDETAGCERPRTSRAPQARRSWTTSTRRPRSAAGLGPREGSIRGVGGASDVRAGPARPRSRGP